MKEEEKQSNSIQSKVRKVQGEQVSPKELWKELNTFRTNPHLLYNIISTRKNCYNKQGLLFSMFHPNRSLKTTEGKQPINQLLEELVNMKPLHPISYNSQLNITADALARQFKACHFSNTEFQINPKQLRQILNKSDKYIFPHPVCCVMGVGFNNQYQPLVSLLIDDGHPARNNRALLTSKQYEVCGVGAVLLQDSTLICAVYLFTRSVIPKQSIDQHF